MPELPEVEAARAVIERAGLGRRITDVDDSDRYVCRPHPPGEIRRQWSLELPSSLKPGLYAFGVGIFDQNWKQLDWLTNSGTIVVK